MSNKYTAIVRKKLSSPMRYLSQFMTGDCLDYGCGRGFDCDYLGIDGYDKHWRPSKPTKKYDVIFCNFVLNVVSKIEQDEVLDDIRSLLKPGGKAYFTVRRDIKRSYKVKDYIQRYVKLDFESILHIKNRYEIYKMGLYTL